MKTKITELLGIDRPIIQASMAWLTNAELVAAVSNSGGIGTLGPNAGAEEITEDPQEVGERMRSEIKKTKELTDKPFAINILVPGPGEEEFSEACLEVAIEEEVPVAIVSQGNPEVYTERLKEAGMKVLHVVSNIRHAEKAEEAGVDAVITAGTEGGGHSGFEHLTTFTMVPTVVSTVDIPVIAGGGVGDGRGLAAALTLGASGVYMGTRFIATEECPAHENYKEALLEAEITDTVAIRHGRPVEEETGDLLFSKRFGSVRGILNPYTKKILNMKSEGKDEEEILEYYTSSPPDFDENVSRIMASAIHGDVEQGSVGAGQSRFPGQAT